MMAYTNITDVESYFKECLSAIDHSLDKPMVFDTPDFQKYPCPHSKHSRTSARYKACSDGRPTLLMQCHKCHPEVRSFPYKGQEPYRITPAERQANNFKVEKRKIEEAKQNAKALVKLQCEFETAKSCVSHGYFDRKNVTVLESDGLRIDKQGLVLCPIRLATGDLVSAQTIPFKGLKLFHKGTSPKGGFHVFGSIEDSDELFFGEGIATCLTIRMITGKPVICVYGKRFAEIAPIIAKTYPGKRLIYCCDLPSHGEKLTSEDNAGKAVALIGGAITLPDFSEISRDLRPEIDRTDWNDYYCLLLASGLSKDDALTKARYQLLTNMQDVSIMKAERAEKRGDGETSEEETPLPQNFKLTDKDEGLTFEKRDKDGNIESIIPVTKRLVKIIGRQSDYYSGENFGLLLKFKDEDLKEKIWAMPSTLMSDPRALEGSLNYRGCYVYDIKKLIIFFKVSDTRRSFVGFSRIGWHLINEVRYFVLPEAVIGNGTDKNRIIYQTTEVKNPYQPKGELKDWQESIGKYLKGQSRLIFGLSFALSSLLLDIVGAENGGVHFHGISSKGKSTLLLLCASLFGDPESYKLSWKSTPNAMAPVAVSRHDGTLILDESSEFENEHNKKLASVIYMLMNGIGKLRLNSDSSLKDTLTWRCNVMSSGENPISQLLNEAGERDNEGVAVRMIDLPAIVGEHGVFDSIPPGFKNGHEFSNSLKEAVKRFHGTVVVAFLNLLINENPEHIKALVKVSEEKIIRDLKAEGQVMRCAKRFALTACAGELAHELLGIKKGEAIAASIACFKAWIKSRGGVNDNEATKLLKQVNAYRDTHNAMFKSIGVASLYEKDNQAGFKENGSDNRLIHYATASTFKIMTKGFSHDFAVETLIKAGFLTEDKKKKGNGRYLRQKKIEGNNSKYYFFDGVMWNMEEPEEVTE